MLIRSRREFMKATLRSVGAVGALGGLAKFGEMNALAATVNSGYKALVCIFLAGGNDGHNTVIPISVPSIGEDYSLYFQGRQTLALPQAGLQIIQNGGDTYGLHPLMPEMAALYNAGNATIVANVGTLVKPIDRPTYLQNNQADIPAALYSHPDQVNQWQTHRSERLGVYGLGRSGRRYSCRAERGRGVFTHHLNLGLRALLHGPEYVPLHHPGKRRIESDWRYHPKPHCGLPEHAGLRQRTETGAGR